MELHQNRKGSHPENSENLSELKEEQLFDLLTFAVLIFLFQASPDLFRTGWFAVSLLTEIGIIFVIRTEGPMLKSRPSLWLLVTAVGTVLISIMIIYLPLYEITGFVPVNAQLMAILTLIVIVYIVITEWVKKWTFMISRKQLSGANQLNRPGF